MRCLECGRIRMAGTIEHHPWEPSDYANLIHNDSWHAKWVLLRWRILRPLIVRGFL